jgi:hypothetical protein
MVQQVNIGRPLPQMMVRVADRQLRLQSGFDGCFTIMSFHCHSQHLQMQGRA